MDNELRQFLEAMEHRIKNNIQAAMESVRDELREEIRIGDRAIRSLVESVRDGLHEIIRAGDRDMALEVRAVRADMVHMERRLVENIKGRREDIDAAFKDIDSLRRMDRDLEKRVTALEGHGSR